MRTMSVNKTIKVEVAYGLPDKQAILEIEVPEGTSALEAAQRSRIAERFPGLSLDEDTKLGVFGHLVAPSQMLRAGDRVEVYRPLIADPKEVRKARAARSHARREKTQDS